MSVFVDTSALIAILDGDDVNHPRADREWRDLLAADEDCILTSYVLVEAFALVQARLGTEAVRDLQENILPLIRIHWLAAEEHAASVTALLIANRRQLSLVDCTSFEVMRRLGIRRAFAFDRHFVEQGFSPTQ